MQIGIVGLGLIGGSLGFDFRAQGHQVLGVSQRVVTGDRAIARGAVDQASTELSLMQTADVVFVCTPLAALASTVTALVPYLKTDAVLTDVGSVKSWVMAEIAPQFANFIGGHPMAGTAESGIEAAQPKLFQGCAYVLTPSASASPAAQQQLEQVLTPLQVNLIYCSPEEHDRAVAWISHLPVWVSAALIAACANEPDGHILELAQTLASSGFRDTSRVGGGNPDLGTMMATYNTEALVRSLHAYRDTLSHLIRQIEQQDWPNLTQTLQHTQQQRFKFLK
jgi:arogenate dehydrogenase (NADP+)